MKLRIVLLSAAACAMLAACASEQAPPGTVDKKSASYAVGYNDGCAASNKDARAAHKGPVKNDQLYSSDASYYAGWNEGYKKCEDKVTPSALPIPGNSVIM